MPLDLPATPRLSPEATRRLLVAAHAGDRAARERLIEGNLRLVASIAQRFVRADQELEDLFQVGCIGLAKAVDRFDLAFDVQFSTYAVPLIIGEIRQHLRAGGAVHVSRCLQQTGRELRRLAETLGQKLGRAPTTNELAEAAGMPADDVTAALEALRTPASLDDEVSGSDGQTTRLHERIADDDARWEDGTLDRLAIATVIAGLDDNERRLLQLRFREHRTQTETAAALEISQPQVSRLERRVLEKLRGLLS